MKFKSRAFPLAIVLGCYAACFSQAADRQQQIAEYTRQAQQYLQQKRPDLAVAPLESLVALTPDNAEAQGNLGVLLYFQNQFAKAVPHLRAAVALQPSLSKIQVLLGQAEARTGDSASAQRDLEAAFSSLHEPKLQVQAGLELVNLYTANRDLAKAAAILAQLRQIDPENKEVLYASYRTYSEQAVESMLTLSLVAPDSAQMHQLLAHEELKEGNTNGAIAEYRKAIAIDPQLPGIHFELAEVLITAGDPSIKQQAMAEYQEALRQSPGDDKTLCKLGELALQRNDTTAADGYYAQAIKLQPDDAEALLGMAKVYMTEQQNAKALPLLERAVQIDPTNATAHYRLSTLYRQSDRTDDAKQQTEEFLKYRQMKDKLQLVYKDLRVPPDAIKADAASKDKP